MNFTTIQRTLKHIVETAFERVGAIGVNPNRDWRALLLAASVLVVLSGIGSGLMFVRVNSGEFAAVAPKTPGVIESIDRAQLTETLRMFAEKEESLDILRVETPALVDPSL